MWPAVEPGLLAWCQRTFGTPLRLDAAFDTEGDCEALVKTAFPDMVEEHVLDAVAQLVQWKEDTVRLHKRARSSIVQTALFHLPSHQGPQVQEVYTSLLRTSNLCILEMHSKRKQRKYRDEAPDARSRHFEAERVKYSMLLAQVIIGAKLPVVELVQSLDDPRSGWVHIFAARRANTLKNRFQVWKPFQTWLEVHRGYSFPQGVKDVIDYMQHRVDDGCGKTVPDSLNTTLGMLELLGRVPESQRISFDPLWKGHVKSWCAELAEDAPPRKPAEMYTIAMLLSLELVVGDEDAVLFERALAWVVLCMVWGAMRCDDVQAIIPHRSVLSNMGLRLVLGRSKTTGPDKVQKEVSVHIHRLTSLTGVDWIRTGFDLWGEEPLNFRRDYLVMEPLLDWTGVKRKFLPPSGLSSQILKLLSALPRPQRTAGGWKSMHPALLLPDGIEAHFSGHSPRNFLTSVAAVLGFPKDQRAYLGRWSMGMVSSEEYVRTSRQVVFKIQKAVCQSILEGFGELYHEDETIGRLCEYAVSTGANPARIKKKHAVMYDVGGRVCLHSKYPTLENCWDLFEADGTAESDDVLCRDVEAQARREAESKPQECKFFITVSRRTAMKRLHLVGCFVKPEHCGEVIFCNEVVENDFDSICQACKKKMTKECGKEGSDHSSTASSSSTDSDPRGDD